MTVSIVSKHKKKRRGTKDKSKKGECKRLHLKKVVKGRQEQKGASGRKHTNSNLLVFTVCFCPTRTTKSIFKALWNFQPLWNGLGRPFLGRAWMGSRVLCWLFFLFTGFRWFFSSCSWRWWPPHHARWRHDVSMTCTVFCCRLNLRTLARVLTDKNYLYARTQKYPKPSRPNAQKYPKTIQTKYTQITKLIIDELLQY